MGKVYTFIHKGHTNTKVKTENLQQYLDQGWEIGNWNQDELNKRSGVGVRACYDRMRSDGTWEEFNKNRSIKVTNTLKQFWKGVDDNYRSNRESKKKQSVENWSDEFKEYVHNKMSASAKADRARTTPEEYHRRSLLATQTRKNNGTFATSSFEQECYNLLVNCFGEEDVVTEYATDSRYPYKCDFYIKSKDLFIELNIHPSHWEHPFDNTNPEDIELLEELRTKNDAWSKMIIDVWSKRDVAKAKSAKEYNLKYIAIYPSNYENFIADVKENRL